MSVPAPPTSTTLSSITAYATEIADFLLERLLLSPVIPFSSPILHPYHTWWCQHSDLSVEPERPCCPWFALSSCVNCYLNSNQLIPPHSCRWNEDWQQLQALFEARRAAWLSDDRVGWLALNAPFPGAVDALASCPYPVYFASRCVLVRVQNKTPNHAKFDAACYCPTCEFCQFCCLLACLPKSCFVQLVQLHGSPALGHLFVFDLL